MTGFGFSTLLLIASMFFNQCFALPVEQNDIDLPDLTTFVADEAATVLPASSDAATTAPEVTARSLRELRRLYDGHLAYVKTFPCREPQPRAIHMFELVSHSSDVYIKPKMTVLHRCENSGCCLDGTDCSVKTEEVVYREVEEHKIDGRVKRMTLPFTNHTSCECK